MIGIIVWGLVGGASAQSKVGTTAANFLTIPVGARASGMGGAFVAVANDASAAFWNPGGLSRLQKNSLEITHANWLVGTDLNWLGFTMRMGEYALGVSINQLDYGEEPITTTSEPEGTGQKWAAQDIAFGISAARNLTDRFSVGVTGKYIKQKISHESATAFAMDVGLLFRTDFNGLRIGMNIANFGSEMKMSGEDLLQPVDIDPGHSGNNENIVSTLQTDSWTLPLAFTVGLGMEAINTENWVWTICTDAIHPNNQTLHLNVGSEIVWNNLFALRGGYNSLFKEAAEEGFSLGFGVRYPVSSILVKMDYGYMDFGVFDGISRYSLSVSF